MFNILLLKTYEMFYDTLIGKITSYAIRVRSTVYLCSISNHVNEIFYCNNFASHGQTRGVIRAKLQRNDEWLL